MNEDKSVVAAQRNRLAVILLIVAALGIPAVSVSMSPQLQDEARSEDQSNETAVAAVTSKGAVDESAVVASVPVLTAAVSRADQLYAQHCEACHGENGDGNGMAAPFLFPKPRNFQAGHFRLVSTTNSVPSTEDLVGVLTRGMPGSSMPPWPQLSQEDARLLADHVMQFRVDAIREMERKLAAEFDEEVDEEEVNELVADLTVPGAAVEVAPIPDSSPESVDRGRELFLKVGCAGCHGKTGRGDGQQKQVEVEGLPTRPRDLTKGIFKGSPDIKSLYIRTQTGMPGTPMPATPKLTHEQIADIVQFVRSLSDDQTRRETVLNRERLTASRIDSLPVSPNDEAWQQIDAVSVRLTPVWWRDEFPRSVDVQSVHDGESISMRLSWSDAEPNMHAAQSEAFEDAVGVELYSGDAEPFLGMGTAKSQLEVWLWDADRQFVKDVDDVNPLIVVDQYPFSETVVDTAEYRRPGTNSDAQPEVSLPARASGNAIVPAAGSSPAAATTLAAGGPGTVTFRPPVSQLVRAEGAWQDGRWNVVLTRTLTVEDGRTAVSLKPGQRVSVAFAVWDGSHRDRDGKKLITIWQDLVLKE